MTRVPTELSPEEHRRPLQVQVRSFQRMGTSALDVQEQVVVTDPGSESRNVDVLENSRLVRLIDGGKHVLFLETFVVVAGLVRFFVRHTPGFASQAPLGHD